MMKWIAVVVLLVGGLGAGGYVYWNGGEKPTAKYKTAKIERGTITQVVTATGNINPVLTVQVGSQVSGIIRNLYADFNSVVKAGELVARIDPAPFQAKVTEMEASLQNAMGNLARARSEFAQRKLDFDRSQALFAQDLIARADVDNTKTAHDTAHAGIQIAEAQVKQAQALLQKAMLDLKYTNIYSPVDGMVISRNVDVGQTVAASFQTPVLFSVAQDLTKMQVDTNVSESDIGGITEAKSATFVVDTYPNQRFEGKVIQVRNAPINVQNVVTYNVVIGVDNTDLRLKPGMTANVSIILDRRDDVLKVPNTALRFKPGLVRPGEKPGGQSAQAAARPGGDGKSGAPAGAGKGGPPDAGSRGGRESKAKSTVWLPNPQGDLTPVELKTGITDGAFTEILEGGVKEGEDIITGLDTSRSPHGGRPGGSLPPGFGPQPSQRPGTSGPRGL
jgi:HlyD family secretion protein